ncbi:Solitary outer membrane autotransporter beta-barrel domain [Ferrimonas marina]|uniref:Solitary outer membrane autotransporter beta-barrel domain-containing protein n=1 Tax=Ferrimonas marina TaxID=299255 RepID=A0A1M5VHY3_9GAMM|nr:Solitary outer membrane autotransporter beta-barrel domain [Ferrimonas marina]SHH74684.1 Solitary outer membrane autotransporter beta-barrel domain-containing protein [Ferrimonas marina]
MMEPRRQDAGSGRPALLGRLCVLTALAAPAQANVVEELETFIRDNIEQTFAATVLITDRQSLSLGFVNFDPNEILPIDDPNLGDETSVELRNELSVYTLPLDWNLWQQDTWQLQLHARAGYVRVNQRLALFGDLEAVTDTNRDETFDLFLQPQLVWDFGRRWQGRFGMGGHLTRYKNKFEYRNPQTQSLEDILEGNLFNFSVDAWQLQPELLVRYRHQRGRTYWQYQSAYSYFWGKTFNLDNPLHRATPEGARWLNGVSMRRPLPDLFLTQQDYRLGLNRIDIRGDVTTPFDTHYYYEFIAEWLINTKGKVPWLDNVGLGLLFNYGSALKGASLVLVYNVD